MRMIVLSDGQPIQTDSRPGDDIYFTRVGAMLTGIMYDKAIVYVVPKIYFTEQFQTWIRDNVMAMLRIPTHGECIPLTIHLRV